MVTKENDTTVCILLASYNGGKFIRKQLESLVAQSYTNWSLFVRDDKSTDETINILEEFVLKDSRISLLKDDLGKQGSCQNFGLLIRLTRNKFPYYMFCDQDDFWYEFKVEETLQKMRELEKGHQHKRPLLVYTNFQYVDDELNTIEEKKNYESTKVPKLSFSHLLAQNPIYGCTMMFNNELVKAIDEVPMQAENHDYWVAMVASAFGEIFYYRKKTILYRQHQNNISTKHDNSSFRKRLQRILIYGKNFEDAAAKLTMALAFKQKFYSQLNDKARLALDEFISFSTSKNIFLLVKNIRRGVRRQTLSQTLLFYGSILLLKKPD